MMMMMMMMIIVLHQCAVNTSEQATNCFWGKFVWSRLRMSTRSN